MRCLSQMSGNLQVRFLGGGAVATSPCYPARQGVSFYYVSHGPFLFVSSDVVTLSA